MNRKAIDLRFTAPTWIGYQERGMYPVIVTQSLREKKRIVANSIQPRRKSRHKLQ